MLFDSDVVIWAMRGNSTATLRIDNAPELALSVVSLMEVLQGTRSKLEMRQTQQSLRQLQFRIVPLSETIGSTAAALIEQHALAHGLQVADALIAATALETGQPLCTANAKHFRFIRGIEIVRFRPARR